MYSGIVQNPKGIEVEVQHLVSPRLAIRMILGTRLPVEGTIARDIKISPSPDLRRRRTQIRIGELEMDSHLQSKSKKVSFGERESQTGQGSPQE